jgi:uncharacterized membrane protein
LRHNSCAVIAEHFIRRWQRAGLIDSDLAQRIRDWEATHRRPVAVWAIAGMGALAMSLGVMAIVGANWEDIPASLKLAIDLGLNALCAAMVFLCWRRGWEWRREIAALLLFALVLSGIALIGQTYQLQSAPWRALVFWLAVCTPFLALTAFSRLSGTLWTIAVVTAWFTLEEPVHDLMVRTGALTPRRNFWDGGDLTPIMAYLAACGIVVIAVLRSRWAPARGQARMMLQLGLAGLAAICSLVTVFDWTSRGSAPVPLGPLVIGVGASLAAAAAAWVGLADAERRAALMTIAGSAAVWVLALFISPLGGLTEEIARAALFIVYWGGIGALAAASGRRGLFGLAFTLVGLRILILYFEAIGGLTATGFGLIGGGILCLALAAIGWRLTRTVPRKTTGATG